MPYALLLKVTRSVEGIANNKTKIDAEINR
jgi:hypothetical protein